MKKVYVITKFDMDNYHKDVVYVYEDKALAKKKIDKLNDFSVMEDEPVFYTMESFNITGEEDD